MHYKFLSHSKGSGRAAIRYLLGDVDHNGDPRELVQVLRGDPHQLGRLIDSIGRVHRYTSGVIAMHQDDKCSDEKLQELIADFERIAFAGFAPDEYSHCIVRHDDHLHIIVAQTHLPSGKRLNVAPPGWQKTFDAWRDYWNIKEGWARPDDPARARDLQPGGLLRTDEWADGDIRQLLAYEITRAIQNGEVDGNRAGVMQWLEKKGEIQRVTKNSISIRLPGEKKNVRLQGRLFTENFNGLSRADLEEQRREMETRRHELAEAARIKFEETVQRRAQMVAKDWEKTRGEVDEQRRRFELLEQHKQREAVERAGLDRATDQAAADQGAGRGEPEESAALAAFGDGLQSVRERDGVGRGWRQCDWRKSIRGDRPLREVAWPGHGRRVQPGADHGLQQPEENRLAATEGLSDEQRRRIDAAVAAAYRAAELADESLRAAGEAAERADRAVGATDAAAKRADRAIVHACAAAAGETGQRDRTPGADAEQPGGGSASAVIARILGLVEQAKRELTEWLQAQVHQVQEVQRQRDKSG